MNSSVCLLQVDCGACPSSRLKKKARDGFEDEARTTNAEGSDRQAWPRTRAHTLVRGLSGLDAEVW